MSYCYLCGKELSDDGDGGTAKRHKEHIIHNGIYGRLKSSTILCEKCGGDYSKSDAKFVDIFKGFTDLMFDYLYSKDHGTEKRKRIKAYLHPNEGEQMEVEYYAGKASPIEPFFVVDDEKKEVMFYANKQRLKEYEKFFIKTYPEYKSYTLIRNDDVTNGAQIGLFFSEKNPEFNVVFKEGIAKIATEFALHSGVDRCEISETLHIQDDGSCVFDATTYNTIPYSMQSAAEIFVLLAEDIIDVNYPCHRLRLFVDEYDGQRKLICYIDLFSTFRYYVILNQHYTGEDVSNDYAQRVLALQDKEGNVMPPEFDLGVALKAICANLMKVINDYYATGQLPNLLIDKKAVEELLGDTIAHEGMEPYIREIVDCLSVEHYMKHVIYHYDDADPSIVSIPKLSVETAKKQGDKIRFYTNLKFNQLNRFCWNVGAFMSGNHSK